MTATLERRAMGACRYTINRAGVLTSVGGDWRAFARENAADESLDEGVGLSMWDAIATVETREVYRRLLDHALRAGSVSFPYRCDSPDEERDLQLTIAALPDGSGWEFISEVREVRPAAVSPLALLDGAATPGGGHLCICGWCARVDHGGTWVDFADYVATTALLAAEELPQITHGICTQCYDGLMADMDAES